MIVAIAFAFFAFGFLAAVTIVSKPQKSSSDGAGLRSQLRLMRSNVLSFVDKSKTKELLPMAVNQKLHGEDRGLLTKYVFACFSTTLSADISIENKLRHCTTQIAGKALPTKISKLPSWQEKVA